MKFVAENETGHLVIIEAATQIDAEIHALEAGYHLVSEYVEPRKTFIQAVLAALALAAGSLGIAMLVTMLTQ